MERQSLTNDTHERINALVADALALAEERSHAETGLTLAGRAIVQFAAQERIKTDPFRYAHIDDRDRRKLAEKPYLDFGRCWPYCFERLDSGLWLPLGRRYKPLWQDQFKDDWYDYDAFAPAAWQFTCDPASLDDVWRKVHTDERGASRLMLYNDDPSGRADYMVRLARVIGATDDPIKNALALMHGGSAPTAQCDRGED